MSNTSSLQADHNGSLSVDGEPWGFFQTVAGGEVTGSGEKDRAPSGNDIDQPLLGPRSIGNVTLTRTWDESRDRALLVKARAKTSRTNNVTAAEHPLDANGNPLTASTVWSPCVIVRAMGPAGDRNSTTKTTFEIELAVGGIGST